MTKKIIVELQASSGQLKSFVADLALSMDPWKRYCKFKIKTGGKIYKLQAPSLTIMGNYGMNTYGR